MFHLKFLFKYELNNSIHSFVGVFDFLKTLFNINEISLIYFIEQFLHFILLKLALKLLLWLFWLVIIRSYHSDIVVMYLILRLDKLFIIADVMLVTVLSDMCFYRIFDDVIFLIIIDFVCYMSRSVYVIRRTFDFQHIFILRSDIEGCRFFVLINKILCLCWIISYYIAKNMSLCCHNYWTTFCKSLSFGP